MKRLNIVITILFLALAVQPQTEVLAQTDPPVVVHAVLFHSPTCGHCQDVINNTLLPMLEQYGDQLQIAGIDVSQQQGQAFFMSAMQKFNLDSAGVPFLVIENTYLIGSLDIPEKFPGMVETYLAQGGVDWPDIPGLTELLDVPQDAAEPTAAQSEALPATPGPASTSPDPSSPTTAPSLPSMHTDTANWRDKFARDPLGNTLSVILLLGMVASIVWVVYFFQRTDGISIKANWAWIIPVLCLIGFGVAGYLAYVETTQTTAVCGPVGDCNTVQQSEYARLFGILPIGVLGLAGYMAIFLSWLVARLSSERPAELAALATFFMTALGTLFSIYLTFLEPFVIGATCAWCLTSAILMTALMLLSVGPAKSALAGKNM